MWKLLCVASALCVRISSGRSHATSLRSAQTAGSAGVFKRRLLEPLEFRWPSELPDTGQELDARAWQWINETRQKLTEDGDGQQVDPWKSIRETFLGAYSWAADGRFVAEATWRCFSTVHLHFEELFQRFQPLEEVLQKKEGFLELAAASGSLHELVNITGQVLNTALVIQQVSAAVGTVSDLLDHVIEVLLLALTERYLKDYKGEDVSSLDSKSQEDTFQKLVSGLGFSEMLESMTKTQTASKLQIESLEQVQDTWQPLIEAVDGVQSRRLQDKPAFARDLQRYTNITVAFLRSWPQVEQLSVSMCPLVESFLEAVNIFVCRIDRVMDSYGIENLEYLLQSESLAMCQGNETTTALPQDTVAIASANESCPSNVLSTSLDKTLSTQLVLLGRKEAAKSPEIEETAEEVPVLSWVLAIIAGLLCLVCIFVGVLSLCLVKGDEATQSRDITFSSDFEAARANAVAWTDH